MNASPTVKNIWITMTIGKVSNARPTGRLNPMTKSIKIGILSRKLIKFDNTTTNGSTSAGKSTFLIKFPPAKIELEASNNEEENHSQGNKPLNTKTT